MATKKAKATKKATKGGTRISKGDANYYPKEGSNGHKIWSAADSISKTKRKPASYEEVKKAVGKSVNGTTVRSGYARWRKFHGVTGRLPAAATA